MALEPLATHRGVPSAKPLRNLLQTQYRERWAVLLDALFAEEKPQWTALNNCFTDQEAHEEILLQAGPLCLNRTDEVVKAFSRHTNSGLLTQFWALPASVLPVVTLSPLHNSSVLILGQPPLGRFLALAQLVLAAPDQQSTCELPSNSSLLSGGAVGKQNFGKGIEQSIQHCLGVSGSATNWKPGQGESAANLDQGPGWQAGLPWFVYGEGAEPTSWHRLRENADSTQLQLGETRSSWSSPQQPWTGLGALVEGLLHRSVRAGCCTVKTSSGDWSELAEQAMQAQLTQQQLQITTASTTGASKAECCGSQSRNVELSEAAAASASGELSHQGHLGGKRSCQGEARLECLQSNAAAVQHFDLLLQNHLPKEARGHIRLSLPQPGSPDWWTQAQEGSRDAVVVEAAGSATKGAVLRACQTASTEPWPLPAQQREIEAQKEALLVGFRALKPGGHLLFCSNSLAAEETDDLVEACVLCLAGAADVLSEPAGGDDNRHLLVIMKQFGVERARSGWRMMPDLSFQGPSYFSLMRKMR